MIADATGAREVLKKQKRRGLFEEELGFGAGEEMNIFEILQMFRDHRGPQGIASGEREHAMRLDVDQIRQLMMGAAQAEGSSDEDQIEDHHENHFGMGFNEMNEPEEAKGEERQGSDEEGLPRFGQNRLNRPEEQVIRGSGGMNHRSGQ